MILPDVAFRDSMDRIGFYDLKYSVGTKGSCLFVPTTLDAKPSKRTKGVYAIFEKDNGVCIYVGQGYVYDRVRKFYRVAWTVVNDTGVREDTRHPAALKFSTLPICRPSLDNLAMTYHATATKEERFDLETGWIAFLKPLCNQTENNDVGS